MDYDYTTSAITVARFVFAVVVVVVVVALFLNFRRKRYTAYRRLLWLCWGHLRREAEVPLPVCAVHRIGRAYLRTITGSKTTKIHNLSFLERAYMFYKCLLFIWVVQTCT